MFTLGLAWVDTNSLENFQLLYLGTFFIDITMWEAIAKFRKKDDK